MNITLYIENALMCNATNEWSKKTNFEHYTLNKGQN